MWTFFFFFFLRARPEQVSLLFSSKLPMSIQSDKNVPAYEFSVRYFLKVKRQAWQHSTSTKEIASRLIIVLIFNSFKFCDKILLLLNSQQTLPKTHREFNWFWSIGTTQNLRREEQFAKNVIEEGDQSQHFQYRADSLADLAISRVFNFRHSDWKYLL